LESEFRIAVNTPTSIFSLKMSENIMLFLEQLQKRLLIPPLILVLGLVWEMEDSSGWKRIEGDFGKF
jgi:hypothetical protein